MRMQKIVVGVDFSEHSEIAIERALEIARNHGAEVVLVHACPVSERPDHTPAVMEGATARLEQLQREQLGEARARLEETRERASRSGVTVSQKLISGFAAVSLCDVSKDLDADMIVVGTHGRHGFDRFLLGSVAERVVRMSDKSVMVVRAGPTKSRGHRKILVPVDFSDISDDVLDAAFALAAPKASVEVLNVWEIPHSTWVTYDVKHAKGGSLREEAAAAATAAGRDLFARSDPPGEMSVAFSELEDSPAHGIQQHIESGDYDLVVMGSHGRRGLRRFMLGSVAEATVRYAPCSVVVVHSDKQEDAQ